MVEFRLFSAAGTYESSEEDYFDLSDPEATAAEDICCTCHKIIAQLYCLTLYYFKRYLTSSRYEIKFTCDKILI